MVYHVLYLAFLELGAFKAHYAVADKYAFQVDLLGRGSLVAVIDEYGQIRDVLPCVGLSCHPKWILGVLRKGSKEVGEGIEVVISS